MHLWDLTRLRLPWLEKDSPLNRSYVVKDWPVEKVVKALGVTAAQAYLAKLRVGEKLKEEVKRLEDQLI